MTVATDLVAQFAPWQTDDQDTFLTVIGGMFAETELWSADQDDGTAGWSILWDVDTCPMAGLPWLAQMVGERLPQGIVEADARQWIRDAPNQIRGTKTGLARAAQRHLTGTRTVLMRERSKLDGTTDADWLTMLTLAGETPNATVTRQDILSTMPADIQLDYEAATTVIWGEVQTFGTWAEVETANPTWGDVAQTIAHSGGGWIIWTNPDDMSARVEGARVEVSETSPGWYLWST